MQCFVELIMELLMGCFRKQHYRDSLKQDVIWNLQPSKLMSKKYYILPYYKKDQWTARTKGMLGAITSQSISK